jgi:D(-)-tartrate dehydratase
VKIVEIREKTVSIASSIANAYIDFSKMTCSIVAVITDVVRDGARVIGYGFNSNGRYGQGSMMRERFIPRLMQADPATVVTQDGKNLDPFAIWQRMMINEKPGGHGERSVAVGTLDMAVWDAVAKIAGKPLYRLLADKYRGGVADEKVWVYAAGGYYYPDKGLRELQDEMRRYLDLGYRVVKMKIGAVSLEEDQRRIEAVLKVVGGGQHLAVDANGRFDLETALRYGEAMRPYNLFWYEEPGDPLDYDLQRSLVANYPLSTATGENLFSNQDCRNLLRYGGMRPDKDWLQFDCALSYGLVEYLRMLQSIAEMGWSTRRLVPHGGHQMSLNIAAGLHLGGNESYPNVFAPFGGFADDVAVASGSRRRPSFCR